MDRQDGHSGIGTGRAKITAVVPAYNEAARIGRVLEVLTAYPHFREIIVVDDGSTDGTGAVAQKFSAQGGPASGWGIRVVRNPANLGKGYAMDRGVGLAQSEIIFFSDADVEGLTTETIAELVAPVVKGEVDMMIGMNNRRWYLVHEMLAFVPLLGGERAVTKNLWQKVPEYYKRHFRVEVALNFFAIYYGRGYQYKILNGVTQTVKEIKYGFGEGLRARAKMFYNIFSAQIRLNFLHTPQIVREGRWLALLALYGAAGTILGTIIFVAIYFGPGRFVRYLFAEKLRDPTANFVHHLLDFANLTAIDTIALIGLFIFVSSICIFLLTRKNLNYLLYGFLYKLKNGHARGRASRKK